MVNRCTDKEFCKDDNEIEDPRLYQTESQFICDHFLIFTTGEFAIGIDLKNEKEIFKTKSLGRYSTLAFHKPVLLRDRKVLLNDKEISTYEDAQRT